MTTAAGISRHGHLCFMIATILYWCSMYTYVPILSPYLESIDFSFQIIGIVLGSYGFTQLLIRFPLGLASDRLRRRKPFMALGFAASAASCLMFIIFHDPFGVTMARVMSGVAASTWVAFSILYASYFTPESATKAMGTISVATVIGQLLGMGASGIISELMGWNATFWLGAASAILGCVFLCFVFEHREGTARIPIRVKDLAAVIQSKMLLRVSLLSVLAHGVLFITMFGFTPSYAVSLGASQAELSLLVFAFMIPHAAASWLSGNKLAPQFGHSRIILTGFIISGICTTLIPAIPFLWVLYVTQAINGLAQGLHMPLLMGLSIQTVDADRRATAMGFYQAVYSAGMFSGPFIAGFLNGSFGLMSGFIFGGLLAASATILTWVWHRKGPSLT
jgi:MFS family permease